MAVAALLALVPVEGLARTASAASSRTAPLTPYTHARRKDADEHVQVLLWNKMKENEMPQEAPSECAATCHVTTDRGLLTTSDVVVFGLGEDKTDVPSRSRPSQRFVAYLQTLASHVHEFREPEGGTLGGFDAEVSYRSSADVWLSPLPSAPVELLAKQRVTQAVIPEALAVYAESTCGAPSDRDAYVEALRAHMPVDGVGDCLHNKDHTGGANAADPTILARYPFTLVLEETLHTDAVGQRLYDAFRAGSVPVYAGAPNIDRFLPTAARDCVVKVSDFESAEQLAKHLQWLRDNPASYRKLLAWKTSGMSSRFVLDAVQAHSDPPLCRLCKWFSHNRTASAPPAPLSDWDARPAEPTISQLPRPAPRHPARAHQTTLAQTAAAAATGAVPAAGPAVGQQTAQQHQRVVAPAAAAAAAALPAAAERNPFKTAAAKPVSAKAKMQMLTQIQAKARGDGLGASGEPGGSSPHCMTGCSGHGSCIDDQCVCDGGWRGVDCDVPEGQCPGRMEDHTECTGHGKCLQEVCLCQNGWIGDGCERVDPRLNMECKMYCGERGACVDGECKCAGGYCGDDCSRMIGECPNWCSGHGECCGSKCSCEATFWGDDCSQTGPACPYDYDCSGHGHCIGGKCACEFGFTDFECSQAVEGSGVQPAGPGSDPMLKLCPGKCNGHGTCVDDVGCDCDQGWEAKGCDKMAAAVCPVDFDCANGGKCVKGRCEDCDAGFTGFDCRDEPNPLDEGPPEVSIGERGNMLLFSALGRKALAPPELTGRFVFETPFASPPVVFLQARDPHPQSVAIAAVGTTKKPHKFLMDGIPDEPRPQAATGNGSNASNASAAAFVDMAEVELYPKEKKNHVVMMATHQLPEVVFGSLKDELKVDGIANVSLPTPLRDHAMRESLMYRPFSFVALERGIWELDKGGLIMVGSTIVCEKLPDGSTFEAAKFDKVVVPFPRAWKSKPVVMVGLMTPMLSAALPGVVGVLRVEKVTLTDFTVRLPAGICDAVNSSRSLVGGQPLQTLLELESRPDDDEWGDDVDEYLTGECVRSDPHAGTHFTNKFNSQTWRDWSGVNASARPCYEPNDEVEVEDTTRYDDTVDAGYGPSESELDVENAEPSRLSARQRKKPPRMNRPETDLAQLSLTFLAAPVGGDVFTGGVELRSKVIELPVTGEETIPVELEIGNGVPEGMAPAAAGMNRATKSHTDGLYQDIGNLTADRRQLERDPVTGGWQYVIRKTKADLVGLSLMSTMYDKTNKMALSVDFKPGREMEMGVSQAINDTVDVSDAMAEASAGLMSLVQEAEQAKVEQELVQVGMSTAAGQPGAGPQAMGEARRFIVKVPDGQMSGSVNLMLDRTFVNPIVVCQSLTKSPLINEPLITRINGISGGVVDMLLVKPTMDGQYAAAAGSSSGAAPVTEKLGVLAIEQGLWTVGDATIYAWNLTTDNSNPHTGWTRVDFPDGAFSSPPVVLTQIQSNLKNPTFNNPHLHYLKAKSGFVDAQGFSVAVETESAGVGDTYNDVSGEGAPGQVIGFIAISSGSSATIDMANANVQADVTAQTMFEGWREIFFASTLGGVAGGSDPDVSAIGDNEAIRDTNTAPIFLANTNSFGSDAPAHLRIKQEDGSGVSVKVENDDISTQRTLVDSGAGGPESVAWAAVSAGAVLKATKVTPPADSTFGNAPVVGEDITPGMAESPAVLRFTWPVPVGPVAYDCPSTTEVPCSNHGQCNSTTGDCICDSFWQGESCQVAKQAYIGENGKVEIDLAYRRHTHKVQLQRSYVDPVVFLGPTTASEGDQRIPLIARVSEIGEDFFYVFLQQPTKWFSGATNTAPAETVSYLVLERGVWSIDDEGNTVDVQRIHTNVSVGSGATPLAYRRVRGPDASTGRKTEAVVMTSLQTSKSRLMLQSVVTKVETTFAEVALEPERPQLPAVPLPHVDVANTSLQNLRLSTVAGITGDSLLNRRITGTLYFDPPSAPESVLFVNFYWCTSRNISHMLATPDLPTRPARFGMDANFTHLAGVPNVAGQHTFTNVDVPVNAKYILAVSRPHIGGQPAFVPIIPDADNPYHPGLVPQSVHPDRIPLQKETVGVLIASAGHDLWDNKSFVFGRAAPLTTPTVPEFVKFVDPAERDVGNPSPWANLQAPPTTYLAGMDYEPSVTPILPCHLCLGATQGQSMDYAAAKVRVEYERKQDKGVIDLPMNLTISYAAFVQAGLLSGKKPGCPNACSSQGSCQTGGVCECSTGFTGEDCSKTVNPAACNPPCRGNRVCNMGECICADGWAGDACDVDLAAGEDPPVVRSCPYDCRGHGTCDTENDYVCQCDLGWEEEDCGTPYCVGGCNEGLSGGTCINGNCTCANSFLGDNCELRECWPSKSCTGHGTCDNSNAVCVCEGGWQGVACHEQTPPRFCTNDCSGHGDCDDGTCHCLTGWKLDDCSARIECPVAEFMGMEQECAGHGYCDSGACVCGPGWVGDACEILDPHYDAECPFNCSGRGTCMPEGCVCTPPFGGRGCRQMMDRQMDMGEVLSVAVKLNEFFPVQRVDFSRSYDSPIVIAKPPSRSGVAAFSVQIIGVGSDHCNVSSVQAQLAWMRNKFQTPLELQKVGLTPAKAARVEMGISAKSASVEELVTFMVVEEGSWDLRNGMLMHAGVVPLARVQKYHGSYPQGFPRYYSAPPAVFVQSQSTHELLIARGRIMSAKTRSFAIGMDLVDARGLDDPDGQLAHLELAEKEATMTPMDDVHIGWISIGPSTSSYRASSDPKVQFQFGLRQFQARTLVVPLTSEWHKIDLATEAALASPRIVADCVNVAAFGMRYHALSPRGVSLGFESAADGNGTSALMTDPAHTATVFLMAFGDEGPLAAHPLACPDKCGYDGLRGQCDKSKCTCDEGWAGLSCKVPALLCPDNCTNNGACTSAGCRCRTGWLGANCSVEAQRVKVEVIGLSGPTNQLGAKPAECPDNCNGHGNCVLGVCQCTDPLWLGYTCGDPNPCTKLCSGHGECIESRGCKCAGGWGGEACDMETLQCPYDYDCGEDGHCVDGACICDDQHFGFNCQRLLNTNVFPVPEEPYIEPYLIKANANAI